MPSFARIFSRWRSTVLADLDQPRDLVGAVGLGHQLGDLSSRGPSASGG
jgi:hypothetical protein